MSREIKFPWLSGEDVLAVRCLVVAYGWTTTIAILDNRPFAFDLHHILDGEAFRVPRLSLLSLRGRLAVLAEGGYGHVWAGDAMRSDPMRQLGANVAGLVARAMRRSEQRGHTSSLPDWGAEKWGVEPLLDMVEVLEEVERRWPGDVHARSVMHELKLSIAEERAWERRAAARRAAEEASPSPDATIVLIGTRPVVN